MPFVLLSTPNFIERTLKGLLENSECIVQYVVQYSCAYILYPQQWTSNITMAHRAKEKKIKIKRPPPCISVCLHYSAPRWPWCICQKEQHNDHHIEAKKKKKRPNLFNFDTLTASLMCFFFFLKERWSGIFTHNTSINNFHFSKAGKKIHFNVMRKFCIILWYLSQRLTRYKFILLIRQFLFWTGCF